MMSGGAAALGLIVLGLGGAIAFEITDQPVERTGSSTGAAPRPSVKTPGHAAPPRAAVDSRLGEILARPVFNPDRKPTGSGSKSVAGLARLTGVVISGSRKIAIFAGPTDGRPMVAEEGSRLNGYQVTEISALGVTVAGPTGTMLMTPAFDAARPPPLSRPPVAVLPKPAEKKRN